MDELVKEFDISNPTCVVSDCESSIYVKKRGLCQKHYRNWRERTLPRCGFEGCIKPAMSAGYCKRHREQRATPQGMRPLQSPVKHLAGMPVSEKIKQRIITAGDHSCWLWQGGLVNGYGSLVNEFGRTEPAHRASYRAFIGPIPDGLSIHHTCANRSCVKPDHLQPVTERENMAEMLERNFYLKRIQDLESALSEIAPTHHLVKDYRVSVD